MESSTTSDRSEVYCNSPSAVSLKTPSELNGTTTAQNQQQPGSSLITIAAHCPAALWKPFWSLDHFEIRTELYDSEVSCVWRAICRHSGITVAIKAYKRSRLSDIERHQVAREIWLHAQLAHPAVIALYAAWKDKDHIYLCMEYSTEGNVWGFMMSMSGKLNERTAVPLVLEPALSALAYLHDLGIIHRDIKPENLLMDSSFQVKIADFGLSIHQGYEVANTRLGTLDYLAPEILACPVKERPDDFKHQPQAWYTSKVDCWSMGVLAYELLTGETPFQAMTPLETLARIQTAEVRFPAHLSEGAIDFISKALTRDPAARPSMQELFEHPWITELATSRATQGRPDTPGRCSSRWSDDGALTSLAGPHSPPTSPGSPQPQSPVSPCEDETTQPGTPTSHSRVVGLTVDTQTLRHSRCSPLPSPGQLSSPRIKHSPGSRLMSPAAQAQLQISRRPGAHLSSSFSHQGAFHHQSLHGGNRLGSQVPFASFALPSSRLARQVPAPGGSPVAPSGSCRQGLQSSLTRSGRHLPSSLLSWQRARHASSPGKSGQQQNG
ncbi:kinase-like domain-containing protein [Haematococcus lacustris]